MHARRLALFVVVTVATGCGDAPEASDAASAAEVVDSAGVRIVRSVPEAWPLPQVWRLSAEPVVEIGELEGAEEYNLDGVVGVTRDGQGRIVVVERGARIRWYDDDGLHLRTHEFRGEGPGEVMAATRMLPYRGDSIYVLAPGGGGPRIPGSTAFPGHELPDRMGFGGFVVFDAEGEFGRQGVVWSEGFRGPYDGTFLIYGNVDMAAAALADGSVLSQANPTARIEGNVGERLDVMYPLTRATPLGAQFPDTVAMARYSRVDVPPGGSTLSSGSQRIAYQTVLFDPDYVAPAAHADRIFLADSETGWISVFRGHESGSDLVESWRPEIPAVPTSDALLDEYLEVTNIVFDRSPEAAADTRDRFTQLGRADSLPVVERLLTDALGYVWMAEGRVVSSFIDTARQRGLSGVAEAGPTRWTVFSPEGVPLGSVLTPAAMRVYEIGEDYVLGTTWDELAVPRVRMYSLDRSVN